MEGRDMKVHRSRLHEERGATAVIVVLSLFALFGMIVLVVDVGGLLYARRGMVNASDAAALAAAQSCVGTTEDAESFADQFALSNADGVFTAGGNISGQQNCHEGRAGYVSVQYTRDVALFFAGVLGVQEAGRVTTAATAHWGPTGSASPIPLVIYEGALQGACEVPFVEPGVTCFIWEDNNISGGGNFGFLDVEEGWNVDRDARCRNTGGANQLADWIGGRDPVATLGLNYPLATWVCTREIEGGNNPAWREVERLIGQERDFPIVGTSPGDGEPSQIPNPQAKYNAIGFAHFEIMDVRMVSKLNNAPIECAIPPTATLPFDLIGECAPDGVGAEYVEGSAEPTPGSVVLDVDPSGVITTWSERPASVTFEYTSLVADCGGNPAPNASAHCLVLKWNGATIGGQRPGGGANLGINSVALCDREIGSCIEPG
jgi:hypothetical protein